MDASEQNAAGLEFIQRLLRLTQDMHAAALAGDWDKVLDLTQQRTDLVAGDVAKLPPAAGSEPLWREAERLNREVTSLTETQLQHLGDTVQSERNRQRLQQSYGA